jgi:hypothetical protein
MVFRVGWIGQISPWKPISTARLIAISAIVPPANAMLRGENRRDSLFERSRTASQLSITGGNS